VALQGFIVPAGAIFLTKVFDGCRNIK